MVSNCFFEKFIGRTNNLSHTYHFDIQSLT